MFKSEVKLYVNDARRVADPRPSRDEPHLKVEFYLTPITPELAEEISEDVREALFKQLPDGGWIPRAMVNEMRLDVSPGKQQFTFRAHEDLRAIAKVIGVDIDGVDAVRAYPDKPHLRLRFKAIFQVDKSTAWEFMTQFWKKNQCVFVEFSPMDASLFENIEHEILCLVCDEKSTVIDSEGDPWCDAHRHQAGPGRELKSVSDMVNDGANLNTLTKRALKARKKFQSTAEKDRPDSGEPDGNVVDSKAKGTETPESKGKTTKATTKKASKKKTSKKTGKQKRRGGKKLG